MQYNFLFVPPNPPRIILFLGLDGEGRIQFSLMPYTPPTSKVIPLSRTPSPLLSRVLSLRSFFIRCNQAAALLRRGAGLFLDGFCRGESCYGEVYPHPSVCWPGLLVPFLHSSIISLAGELVFFREFNFF